MLETNVDNPIKYILNMNFNTPISNGDNHDNTNKRTVLGEVDFLAIHDTEEMIVVAVFKDTVDGWTGLKERLPYLSQSDINQLCENMATEDKRFIIYPVEELLL